MYTTRTFNVPFSGTTQIGFTFLVPAHPGSPRKRAIKWVCVLSRTIWVSQYQKGKTNLDFIEARDSKWHWHKLGNMQVCTLLQTDNQASTSTLSFFTGQMPFLPAAQPSV